MKKVYFMIYDMGAGHRSTANALKELIEQKKLPWEVHIVEVFKEVFNQTINHYIYNELILKRKWAKLINDPFLVPLFRLQIRFKLATWRNQLRKYWRKHQPDLVVSLLPLVNQSLYESLQAELPETPFVTSITDFADCPPHFWIEPQEQFLICPSERTVKQAQACGYSEQRIFQTSGVVIHPRFNEPGSCSDCSTEKQRLGLDPNLPTGLVIFGSYGSKEMIEIAKRLEQSSQKLQLIYICGRNEQLAKELHNLPSRLPKYVEGFTKQIPYYMDLSDFFIGKPGSVGISEAIARKLPVITECNHTTTLFQAQFTEWRYYYHHVLGVVEGKKVPIPFNLNSLYALFPPKYAEKLENLLLENFGFGVKVPILKLRESASGDLSFLADYIYDNVFLRYTMKQWGVKPEELDQGVTGRVPVYISRDNRYFQDPYQAMPKLGYTEMFRKMLAHPNIKVLLNTDYREIINDVKFNRIICTAPIDAFFDYIYGELPYRSLRFQFETLDQEQYQEVGTVNYPNDYEITRITEQKYLSGQTSPKTTLVMEYPQAYVPGKNDPYYPILNKENRDRLNLYLKEVEKLNGTVLFAGRLGDYKYYDMDQAVVRALGLFEKEIANPMQEGLKEDKKLVSV